MTKDTTTPVNCDTYLSKEEFTQIRDTLRKIDKVLSFTDWDQQDSSKDALETGDDALETGDDAFETGGDAFETGGDKGIAVASLKKDLSDAIGIVLGKYFSSPENATASYIVDELGDVFTSVKKKLTGFPILNIDAENKNNMSKESYMEYFKTIKKFLEEYRIPFNYHHTFENENEAKEYLRTCGLRNIDNVGLYYTGLIRYIESDSPDKPIQGLGMIDERYEKVEGVYRVNFDLNFGKINSISCPEDSKYTLQGVEHAFPIVEGVKDAQYIKSDNVCITIGNVSGLSFSKKFGALDLTKVTRDINQLQFDYEGRVIAIMFTEGVEQQLLTDIKGFDLLSPAVQDKLDEIENSNIQLQLILISYDKNVIHMHADGYSQCFEFSFGQR